MCISCDVWAFSFFIFSVLDFPFTGTVRDLRQEVLPATAEEGSGIGSVASRRTSEHQSAALLQLKRLKTSVVKEKVPRTDCSKGFHYSLFSTDSAAAVRP